MSEPYEDESWIAKHWVTMVIGVLCVGASTGAHAVWLGHDQRQLKIDREMLTVERDRLNEEQLKTRQDAIDSRTASLKVQEQLVECREYAATLDPDSCGNDD